MSRHTGWVDWRIKSFEAQARSAFAFLTADGFALEMEPGGDHSRRPTALTLRARSVDATVETSLVLGFAGEDGIHTILQTVSGRSEFGPTVAHKGHEMEKALRTHAEGVRAALSQQG